MLLSRIARGSPRGWAACMLCAVRSMHVAPGKSRSLADAVVPKRPDHPAAARKRDEPFAAVDPTGRLPPSDARSAPPERQWQQETHIERRRKKKQVADEEFSWGATERMGLIERRAPCLFALHRVDTVIREVDADGPVTLQVPTAEEKTNLLRHYCALRGKPPLPAEEDIDEKIEEIVEMPALLADTVPLPAQAEPSPRPEGFRFTLFKENVATTEALFILATRFSIPHKNLYSRMSLPKLASTTQKCWIRLSPELRHVTSELLYSINHMKFIGFVLRIGSVEGCSEEEWKGSKVQSTSFQTVLRDVRESSVSALEARLASLREGGYINYVPISVTYALSCIDVYYERYQRAVRRNLSGPTMHREFKEFLRNPTVRAASEARSATRNAIHRRMLKAFIESGGDASAMLAACGTRPSWRFHLQAMAWNFVCSKRVREHGTVFPMVGDFVIRPDCAIDGAQLFREHVTRIQSEDEASKYKIEDVVLPMPHPSFDTEADYPTCPGASFEIYKEVFRKISCPKFLEVADSDVSPFLYAHGRGGAHPVYRRLLSRPLDLQWEILQTVKDPDNAPSTVKILFNDRMLHQRQISVSDEAARQSFTEVLLGKPLEESVFAASDVRANRRLVPAKPVARDVDQVYTQLNVVLFGRLAKYDALDVMLREAFALRGIFSEEDSRLQHAIHYRLTQEDWEWAKNWEAPACYCCYSRSHHMLRLCALNQHRRALQKEKRALADGCKKRPPLEDGAGRLPLISEKGSVDAADMVTETALAETKAKELTRVDVALKRPSTTISIGLEVDNRLRILRVVPGSPFSTFLTSRKAEREKGREAVLRTLEGLVASHAIEGKLRKHSEEEVAVFVEAVDGNGVATRSELRSAVQVSANITLTLMSEIPETATASRQDSARPKRSRDSTWRAGRQQSVKRPPPQQQQRGPVSGSGSSSIEMRREQKRVPWGLEILRDLTLCRIRPDSPAAHAVASNRLLSGLIGHQGCRDWKVGAVDGTPVATFEQLETVLKLSETKLQLDLRYSA